ncbi:molybdopterin-guanine dinucleotide biosynthesis protein B [bacterium]|nr:molybdopterin-guanine dinucleotide biosynthesis protein B [bacterium]
MSVKFVSFVGRSNSGKTTLITRLIPILQKKRITIGTIKHTHHSAEFDKPGKDSWRHRQAGSEQVLLLSHDQLALYRSHTSAQPLAETVQQWFSEFDLVISEGFKYEDGLKIEVFRQATEKTPLYIDPSFGIQALVSDITPERDITHFKFEDLDMISNWILEKTEIKTS